MRDSPYLYPNLVDQNRPFLSLDGDGTRSSSVAPFEPGAPGAKAVDVVEFVAEFVVELAWVQSNSNWAPNS